MQRLYLSLIVGHCMAYRQKVKLAIRFIIIVTEGGILASE